MKLNRELTSIFTSESLILYEFIYSRHCQQNERTMAKGMARGWLRMP